MRRGRKNSWRGEQWIVPQERREGKGGENRDKKKIMVKLIIQKKKTGTTTTKSSVCLAKFLDLFLWDLILESWYWHLVFWALWGRVLSLLSDSLEGR
jgi:hypothetical protein